MLESLYHDLHKRNLELLGLTGSGSATMTGSASSGSGKESTSRLLDSVKRAFSGKGRTTSQETIVGLGGGVASGSGGSSSKKLNGLATVGEDEKGAGSPVSSPLTLSFLSAVYSGKVLRGQDLGMAQPPLKLRAKTLSRAIGRVSSLLSSCPVSFYLR